ncbi:exonuclease SbcCD subunit D [Candidatus Cloacimonadota bacterium]
MVKILLFADTHLGFDHPVREVSLRPRRGIDFFKNYKRILKYALDNDVDLLVHGGDFFFRSKVPPKIVTEVYEILFQFAEKGIPIVIVPGNHERSILPDSFLTRHPNIYIFAEEGQFSFELKGHQFELYGFPFIRNNIDEEFPRIVERFKSKLNPDHYNLLCLHQAIEGSRVEKYTFRKGPDVISFKDIPDCFNVVFSGHIHRHQILWKHTSDKQIPVVYPGSTERTSFQEKNEIKGFYQLGIEFNNQKDYCSKFSFIELPTRDMVDLGIPGEIADRDSFEKWLRHAVSNIAANSILRFRGMNRTNKDFISNKYLKEILHDDMIVQFAGKRLTNNY